MILETPRLPLTLTEPIPWFIDALDVLDEVHDKVAPSPESTVDGLILRVHAGAAGGGGGVERTVTAVEHVAVPPAPLTVSV